MVSRLRILEVGPLPPPVGGMASVVSNLASALAAIAEVRVLSNTKTTAPDRSFWEGAWSQLRLLSKLAAICVSWRPQIVHIHTCSGATLWRNSLDVLVVRTLGRHALLHIHGAQFHLFLERLSRPQALFVKVLLRMCDRVIVLGQGWKSLLDTWCEPSRVVVVTNGVSLPAPVAAVRDPFLVICLANYEQRKGQRDLIAAAARLRAGGREVHVALLGFESQPGNREKLLNHAAAVGVAAFVSIPGPVVGADKEAWWSRSSCFCLPSYDEGLPMAMLEAMALGLPIVATKVGAIPEAVIDGQEGLLYRAGDIDALTAHLQALFDDPAIARRLASAGRERVKRDFTLDASALALRRICEDVTASRRTKGREPGPQR